MKKIFVLLFVLTILGTDDVSSQWASAGSHIYNTNAGFVGIGTNTPAALLHVARNMTEPAISVQNLGGSGGATFSMIDALSGANWKFKATNSGGFKIRDNAASLDVITIEPNSTANALYINTAGYLGINTNSPIASLQLNVSTTNAYAGLMIKSTLTNGKNLTINQGTVGKLNFTDPGVIDLVTMDFNLDNVGIGNPNPVASAALDISSTTKGLLVPRMTLNELNQVANPANGLLVFNTTDDKFYAYISAEGVWKELLYGSGIANASCGTLVINHTAAGGVAPEDATITYGTVTGVAGEPTKCWITKNLGALNTASAINDGLGSSAGWYWQFNKKQGYLFNGTVQPAWTINAIVENSDWISSNDPCRLELGSPWHVPSGSEWANFYNAYNWEVVTPYDTPLKLHCAGYLQDNNGGLIDRGTYGKYWSRTQSNMMSGNNLVFYYSGEFGYLVSYTTDSKAYGMSVRCIK